MDGSKGRIARDLRRLGFNVLAQRSLSAAISTERKIILELSKVLIILRTTFFSVLRRLQSLDLTGGEFKRKLRAKVIGPEFSSYYGSDAGVLEKWQALCQDCGVNPVPPSVTQCKKVRASDALNSDFIGLTYVNISFQLIRR